MLIKVNGIVKDVRDKYARILIDRNQAEMVGKNKAENMAETQVKKRGRKPQSEE